MGRNAVEATLPEMFPRTVTSSPGTRPSVYSDAPVAARDGDAAHGHGLGAVGARHEPEAVAGAQRPPAGQRRERDLLDSSSCSRPLPGGGRRSGNRLRLVPGPDRTEPVTVRRVPVPGGDRRIRSTRSAGSPGRR